MKTLTIKSEDRGHANHGWLNAKHSFSFANYYNPQFIHFGALRVLNDDIIAGGAGFPEHPHDNMEIITIPLTGSLEHKDSLGNSSIIQSGEVQVMSAGKGVFHSEFNHDKEQLLNLFQIWIFTNSKNVEPRYDQMSIKEFEKENAFFQVVGPYSEGNQLWIYQNAWLHLGHFNKSMQTNYSLKDKDNGAFIMVIEGQVQINDQILNNRDAVGISETKNITIDIIDNARLLIIEVPMQF